MKQWYKALLLILAVSLFIAFWDGYHNRSYKLVGVSDAAFTKNGIYLADNDGTLFNFFYTDLKGVVRGEIVVPKLKDGWWSNYLHLTVDHDGKSYVYGYQRSMESKEERSIVYYCDYEDEVLVPVWELPGNKIIKIQVKDGILYTALPYEDENQKTAFYAIDKEYNKELLYLADIPYLKVVSAFISENGDAYWSDYHGIVYRNGKILAPSYQTGNQQYNIRFQEHGVVFSDWKDNVVREIEFESGVINNLHQTSEIKTLYENLNDRDIMPVQYTEEGGFLATVDLNDEQRVLMAFDKDGKEIFEWKEMSYSQEAKNTRGIYVFLKVFLSLALLLACAKLGLKLTHGTIPLMAKLAVGMIPVIIVFGYILESQIGSSLQNRMKQMEYNLLYALADQKLSGIAPEYFVQMDITKIPEESNYEIMFPEEDFSQLKESLHNEQEGEDKDIVVRTFQWIYLFRDGYLRYVKMDDDYYGARVDDFRSAGQISLMLEAMREQSIIKTQYNDIEGNWISLFVPVVDADGVSIGVMESGMSMGVILYETEKQMSEIKLRILFIMLLLSIILITFLTIALWQIGKLRHAVGRMAAGHLGEMVEVRGRDEIAGITSAFNVMSLKMKEHVDFIRQCSDAYAKFVPEKIFEILGRENVTKIQLGDCQEIDAGMLLIHENNFRERLRNMNGESLFSMINRMMDEMVPLVTAQDGVVEEMKESGLTGFFVESSKRALESALAIQETFEQLRIQGEMIPDFRAAVTYGRIRLGVIGHDEKIEASTVTELSGLSEFLAGIAEKYGACILITSRAADQVPDFKERYHSRLIGYIYMEKLDILEGIYDVYDADSRQQKILKADTYELFEGALKDFLAGQYYEARQKFAAILRLNSYDKAAKEYIYRCDVYYQTEKRTGKEMYMEIY